jgi:hypothetical protein
MYNSMCFRVHLPLYLQLFFLYSRELFTPGFYISEDCSPSVFIFQRTVHPRFLYLRELFTPAFLYFRELFTFGFYISENCSPLVFIFQRTVLHRFLYFRELFTLVFIFQRTVHPRFLYFRELFPHRFLYFRELFTPGFYISENCSPLGFSGVRVAHSLPFCVMFCQPTCFLNMVIVFSDLLAITVFDDHFWYLQAFLKYCT